MQLKNAPSEQRTSKQLWNFHKTLYILDYFQISNELLRERSYFNLSIADKIFKGFRPMEVNQLI